jgi:hypothetical protein
MKSRKIIKLIKMTYVKIKLIKLKNNKISPTQVKIKIKIINFRTTHVKIKINKINQIKIIKFPKMKCNLNRLV